MINCVSSVCVCVRERENVLHMQGAAHQREMILRTAAEVQFVYVWLIVFRVCVCVCFCFSVFVCVWERERVAHARWSSSARKGFLALPLRCSSCSCVWLCLKCIVCMCVCVFVCLCVCVELIHGKVAACTISEVFCVSTCGWMCCDGVRVRVCLRECVGVYTPLKAHARCTPLHYTLYTTNINTVKGAILSWHVQDVRLYYPPYNTHQITEHQNTLPTGFFFSGKKALKLICIQQIEEWADFLHIAHRTSSLQSLLRPSGSLARLLSTVIHTIFIYVFIEFHYIILLKHTYIVYNSIG